MKKSFHEDCAMVYRGVRIYHTLKGLSAGRQNANYSEHWLTWQFSDRNYDQPGIHQFDIRELTPVASGFKPARALTYASPLLTIEERLRLQQHIDKQKASPSCSASPK